MERLKELRTARGLLQKDAWHPRKCWKRVIMRIGLAEKYMYLRLRIISALPNQPIW